MHVVIAENNRKKRSMKILAVAACIVLAVMLVAPVVPQALGSSPAVMSVIQYRFFSTQDALFTALLTPDSQGGVDVMGWPLTQAEYNTAINNTGIVVEPLAEAGEYELGFNCNWTNPAHPNGRSAMNYTDFRQALACLVDKDGVIDGPKLQGFATRDDTQIPNPLMSAYVNPAVSYPNYPWEFNVTNALYILYRGGWYNHTLYPSFQDLLSTYGNGTLATYGGTTQGVVYPSADPYGHWGGTDTYVNPRAGQPIDALQGYVRTGDARKDLGDMFCATLGKIGINYTEHYPSILPFWFDVVTVYYVYDFATFGYSMASPPNWWYEELTPEGIYAHGPNPYLVDDANMTYWATKAYLDPMEADYMNDIMNVQDILVNEAYLVSVFSPATYCAYKTGMLGMINELGYDTQGNGQLLNWITMNARKNTTIPYIGPPANAPEGNVIYYGEYNPPDMLNPIFADTVFDFQVLDEMFTYPLATNPTNAMVPGSALTGYSAGGDLPWMAYAWKVQTIDDPTNGTGLEGDSNVTLWFRHDVTWQDGVPFTVDDVNYTIYVDALYGDSWDNGEMMFCVNRTTYAPFFQKWDDWTCSIQVSTSSWMSLYTPMYEIVPEHLYKYIVPSNITAAEQGLSTDGLHGLWPGQGAVGGNVLPGAPFTLSDLQNKAETTLVGTGPWKYRVGSWNPAVMFVSGITLDAYSGFFMTLAPGAIAFKYTWLNTAASAQPSGGYFKVGLSDLVYLANAYGTNGTPPSTVLINSAPGAAHTWNPAADLAAPSGSIGLSDLVTLALHYGWYWGNYSYDAPYPPAEQANSP
jgi:ABC-type transport system substrate-binding protein